MNKIIALALKDLRLMPRNRGGMFFTFVWPILVTVLFGIMFGGQDDGEQGKVRIAVVDEDNTDGSRAFLKKLEDSFELSTMTAPDAETAVRRGQRTGFIVVKPGFGEASSRMFYGTPKEIEVGVDPARQAEAGMIEGLLMKHAATDMQKMFNDPQTVTASVDKALGDMAQVPPDQAAPVQRFLGELKTFMGTPQSQGPPGSPQGEWQPLKITKKDVARVYDGPRNPFDITFPQGVIWGLIGCAMSFGISLVTERTHGTLVRLRVGDADAAGNDRRCDGADLHHAGVDSVDQFYQSDPLDDARHRRGRVAPVLNRRDGAALRDPDYDRHRLLRYRHARTAGSLK